MTSAALSERVADVAGPIVVKEVRQGLRAKVFAIFFGLLLAGCLVTALVAAAEYDREQGAELGPEYFRLFLWALAIVEYFVIPYTAFRAMAREREDETWVLLVLTGLGARRIVRGKLSAALAQGLLYASACAPFVLFSYYLNGIDLPTVLTALAMAAAWSTLLIATAVAAATQAHGRVGRALVHFVVLFGLLASTVAGVAFSAFFSEEGGRLLREQAGFRGFCLALVIGSLTTAAVASEGAASGLALLSENAARGPRLALSAQVLLAVVLTSGALLVVDGAEPKVAMAGSIASSLYFAVCGVFAASEPDGFPPAFARAAAWARPGALRSFVLVLVLLCVSTAAWALVYWRLAHDLDDKWFRILLVAPLYAMLYLSLGVVFGRLTPLERIGEPIATRAGFAIAIGLGIFVPMFFAELTAHDAFDRSMNVLNPLLGLGGVNSSERGDTTLTLAASGALMFAFAAVTVLATRDGERRS